MSSATLAMPRAPTTGKGLGGRVNTFPLVSPSVGLLLIWSLVPLAFTLYFSFRRYFLLNPERTGWAGTTTTSSCSTARRCTPRCG